MSFHYFSIQNISSFYISFKKFLKIKMCFLQFYTLSSHAQFCNIFSGISFTIIVKFFSLGNSLKDFSLVFLLLAFCCFQHYFFFESCSHLPCYMILIKIDLRIYLQNEKFCYVCWVAKLV